MLAYLRKALNPILGGQDQAPEENYTDNDGEEQLSIGAPVEKVNPLGYNLDYYTAFFFTIQGMIGTGIFATPASVVKSIGSIGASYVLWICGFIIALFEVLVYVEFVTYFKRRSGGDVVYLEQAYPKPDYLVSTTYAAVNVILSFATSSAIAASQYILLAAGKTPTAWEQRGVGVAVLTFVFILSSVNTRLALKLSNLLGFIKVAFCVVIIITGFVVLGKNTSVKDPTSIFKNSWEGTTSDGNAISNAILKVSFSYGGTGYVIAVAGESHPSKTKKMFKYFIPGTMFTVFVIYLLMITAYYAGVSNLKAIKSSGTLIAGQFFDNVFHSKPAKRFLDVMVALSALGHLIAVEVGHSRSLRECGRQGVLPFPRAWTSTKPFGTPLLPLAITYLVNLIVLLAPPPGDAYNFVVDIGSFSGYIFKLVAVVGLFLLRKQRKKKGLGFAGFKVPLPILIITTLYETFVIAMSFVPPKGTLIGSDVSFFYATYAFTTIGILLLCIAYYYVWAYVLPKIGGYQHRTKYYTLDNGEKGHSVVKVKNEDLEEWDAVHRHDELDSVSDEVIGIEEVITPKKE